MRVYPLKATGILGDEGLVGNPPIPPHREKIKIKILPPNFFSQKMAVC
jgi:hypothetical protein